MTFSRKLHRAVFSEQKTCHHPIRAIMDNGKCKDCGNRVTEAEPDFYPRATPADISRIYRQLWGDCPPSVVDEYYQLSEQKINDGSTQGMVLDRTQITAEIIADTCPHMKVKVHHELFRPETREEPAEYIVTGTCVYCGEEMDGDDIPDYAEVQ